tara:strand:+ start:1107 stop:2108 length:1002 start_codon:yes stop_codon:yes gene_type:complete
MSLCADNISFDAVTEKALTFKDTLKSKLNSLPSIEGGVGGIFSSASDLKSLVEEKVVDLKSQMTTLLPEIPEIPALSLQSELTSLAGFDLTSPSGLLSYKSKLSSITESFGSSLSSSGFSLDDIISKAAPPTAGLTSALSTATGLATSGLSGALNTATGLATSTTTAATGALSSVTSGASGALSTATGLATSTNLSASGGLSALGGIPSIPSIPSFDICTQVPNFELPAGATEATQSALDSFLSSTSGVTEEFSVAIANVDLNAQMSILEEKMTIFADPDFQDNISNQISSAVATGQEQLSSAIETVTPQLEAGLEELNKVDLSGITIPTINY